MFNLKKGKTPEEKFDVPESIKKVKGHLYE